MDRYQIYESIGSSTHSIVYKARERKTIRFVAVRSTDKSQRQKVVHEVRTVNNGSSELLPNIKWCALI